MRTFLYIAKGFVITSENVMGLMGMQYFADIEICKHDEYSLSFFVYRDGMPIMEELPLEAIDSIKFL